MKQFDIPIALFLFKRTEKTVQIVKQIGKVKPRKIYLIGDGPRSKAEEVDVLKCREEVEKQINWNCEIVRYYSKDNRGVYSNIAGGALWVFERESKSIFLEDDNYPSLSFFQYCKELLEKYEDDTRVLWICGTNYMQEYNPMDGSDYVFTKLMLPCGWASWASKFKKFYDGAIRLYRDPCIKMKIKGEYSNKLLYNHDFLVWEKILNAIDNGRKPNSWDYQMAFALRVNNLYGIAPRCNLIRNIGVDVNSIHGGNSMNNIMTRRFCDIPIKELNFPLKHPKSLLVDNLFERKMEKIIILPFKYRIRGFVVRIMKKILGINQFDGLFKRR